MEGVNQRRLKEEDVEKLSQCFCCTEMDQFFFNFKNFFQYVIFRDNIDHLFLVIFDNLIIRIQFSKRFELVFLFGLPMVGSGSGQNKTRDSTIR